MWRLIAEERMKNMRKKFFEGHRGMIKKLGCLALAAVIAGTGMVTYRNTTDIPELVTFVDPEVSQVEEDAVPLASKSKTTKKVTRKTTTHKTTMAKKAKKSKTTTKKTTKNSTKTTANSLQKVKTNTKVVTTVKTQTKKNSKIKTTRTNVVTTVTTTTTQLEKKQYSKNNKTTAAAQSAAQKNSNTTVQAGTYNIRTYAPAADARVLNAFEKIGCKLVVKPNVSYSGCFDARNRSITLKKMDSTVYHELGHFVEFVGGTSAVKKSIASAYSAEKSKYTAFNKAYVLQNSSEYFAESFKNYCENPAALKQARPKTYEAINQALQNMTDSRVNTLIGVYKAVWK